MIRHCKKTYDIKDDFFERVMNRENVEPTEYGNYIAIPHPLKHDGTIEWISVARLDKPIQWNNQKVQLIFLINIFEHKKIAWFMQKISIALAKESVSKALIDASSYEDFINEFKKIA